MTQVMLVSLNYETEQEPFIHRISKGVSSAHHKLIDNIAFGLDNDEECELTIVSSIPVGSFPKYCKKIIFKSRKRSADRIEIGYINIPFLKHMIRKKILKRIIRRWNRKHWDKKRVIVLYDAYMPFINAVLDLKKIGYKVSIIVPDLPGKLSIEYKSHSALTEFYKKIREIQFYKNIRKAHGYILLTKYMYEVFGGDKPYIVVEGMVDKVCENKWEQEVKKNMMYAGELSEKVGIDRMIEAFLKAGLHGWNLILCGWGNMEEFVKTEAQKNSNIKFLGLLTEAQLAKEEEKVGVYINPRQDTYQYTKYSFPSKNLEYLKTGKPLIAYKLAGIPDEYDGFINYPKGNRIEDLTAAMREVCNMDEKLRKERYERQLKFMRDHKTREVQGKKIASFIKQL